MKDLSDLWTYRALTTNFARRELKGRYRGSVAGWLWSLANPAATLLIFTLVFSTIFQRKPPLAGNGTLESYTIYLFIGLVCWNFFNGIVTTSMGSLIGAGPLLKKIRFPAFAPVIGNAMSAGVQTLIEFGILLVVLAFAQNLAWATLFIPVVFLLLAVFSLGIGLMVSVANVRYKDVSHLVGIGLQLLFYATPIIYAPEDIPVTTSSGIPARALLGLNPLSWYVQAARDVLWYGTMPSLLLIVGMVAVAVVVFLLGWSVFQRAALDIAEEL
ncbi:ABC transporter permease [Cellulomonas sp. URHB0016]